jgi:membrane-associated phospholipid phosphatase
LLVSAVVLATWMSTSTKGHAQGAPPAAEARTEPETRSSTGVAVDPPPSSRAVSSSLRLEGSSRWRSSFRGVRLGLGLTGALAAGGALAMRFAWEPPTSPAWPGAGLVDRSFADALRAERGTARDRAIRTSDVLLASLMAYPFVEALFVGLRDREAWFSSAQLSAVAAIVIATNLFVTQGVKLALARGRAYVATCDGAEPHPSCGADDSYQSMPSGHASSTFVTAGLVCASQRALPIYGRGQGGAVACASLVAAATTTAALRVVGDKHWLSDVLVGGTLGFLLGYLVPTFAVFRTTRHRGRFVGWSVTPWASAGGAGLVAGRVL